MFSDWSSADFFRFTFDADICTQPSNKLTFPREWRDTANLNRGVALTTATQWGMTQWAANLNRELCTRNEVSPGSDTFFFFGWIHLFEYGWTLLLASTLPNEFNQQNHLLYYIKYR